MVSLTLEKLNMNQSVAQTENKVKYDLSNIDFCYVEYVSYIAGKILKDIHASKYFTNLELEWYYPIDESVWEENWSGIGAFFTVDCSLKYERFKKDHPGWNIKGYSGWGYSGANIEIEILIDPSISLVSYQSILAPELSNVIAHEIHHLTQYSAPFQRPNCPLVVTTPVNSQTHFEYFTSRIEIPAFIIGFRAESLIIDKPIEILMDEYLLNQETAKLISVDEKQKIRAFWLRFSEWQKKDEYVPNIL
jgi:hypothetical protein